MAAALRTLPCACLLAATCVAATFPSHARADERLAGRACRSVHLRLPAPEADLFYQEMTVRQSAPGTYFMACGWSRGYFGVQDLADGRKLALFSVWEPPAGQNPDLVPADRRVKVRGAGERSRVKRFGGEGTGGQCFLESEAANWRIGDVCRFLVAAAADMDDTGAPVAGRTVYTGYFSRRAGGEREPGPWYKMASFSTLAPRAVRTTTGEAFEPLRGLYTFVEDFRRNGVGATRTRRAEFGPGWVRTVPDAAGDDAGGPRWVPLDRAKFTADGNPARNIFAATLPGETPTQVGRFVLSTGGDTPEGADDLGETLTRPTSPAKIAPRPPRDLPTELTTE